MSSATPAPHHQCRLRPSIPAAMASGERVDEFGSADAVIPASAPGQGSAPAPEQEHYRGDAGAVPAGREGGSDRRGGGPAYPRPERSMPPRGRRSIEPAWATRGRSRSPPRGRMDRGPPPGRGGGGRWDQAPPPHHHQHAPRHHHDRRDSRGPPRRSRSPPSRGSPPPQPAHYPGDLKLGAAAVVGVEEPPLGAPDAGGVRHPWVEGVSGGAPGGQHPPPPPPPADYAAWAAQQPTGSDRATLETGYKEYIAQYERQMAHSFFLEHRHHPWFRAGYDPVLLLAQQQEAAEAAAAGLETLQARVQGEGGLAALIPEPKKLNPADVFSAGSGKADGAAGGSFWGDRSRLLKVVSVPSFVDPDDVLDAVAAVTEQARAKAQESAEFAVASAGGAEEGAVSAAARLAEAALASTLPPVAIHAGNPARGMGRGDIRRTYHAWVEFPSAEAAKATLSALSTDRTMPVPLTRHASLDSATLLATQKARAEAFLATVCSEVGAEAGMADVAARRQRGQGLLDDYGRPVRGAADAWDGDRRAYEDELARERKFGKLVTARITELAGADAVLALTSRLSLKDSSLPGAILGGASEVWGLLGAAAEAAALSSGATGWHKLPDVPPPPTAVASVSVKLAPIGAPAQRFLPYAASHEGVVARDTQAATALARALDIERGLSPMPQMQGVQTAPAGGAAEAVEEDSDEEEGAVAESPAAAAATVTDAAAFKLVTSSAWLTSAPTQVDAWLATAAPATALQRLDAVILYLSWVHQYHWYAGLQCRGLGDWMQVGSDTLQPRVVADASIAPSTPAVSKAAASAEVVVGGDAPAAASQPAAEGGEGDDTVVLEQGGAKEKDADEEEDEEGAGSDKEEEGAGATKLEVEFVALDALPSSACGAVCTLGKSSAHKRMLATDRAVLGYLLRLRTARRRGAVALGVPLGKVFQVEEKALHLGQMTARANHNPATADTAAADLTLDPMAFPLLPDDMARDVNFGQRVVGVPGVQARAEAVSSVVTAVLEALGQDELLAAWYDSVTTPEGEPDEHGKVFVRCLLGKKKLFQDRAFAVKHLKKKQAEAVEAATVQATATLARAVQLRVADAFMWSLFASDTARVARSLPVNAGPARALDVAVGGLSARKAPGAHGGGGHSGPRQRGGRHERGMPPHRPTSHGRGGGHPMGGGRSYGPPPHMGGGPRSHSRGRRAYIDPDAGLSRAGPVPGASRLMQGAVGVRAPSYGRSHVSYDDI